MLPDPTFSFSIPSVHHDDILLECRLYSPPPSSFNKTGSQSQIAGGAIIAHPYASFGGCYDDHVVLGLVKEILRCGFVVGTFNFRYRLHCVRKTNLTFRESLRLTLHSLRVKRGAGGSGGRTSWTSKPEIDDYVSFIGFFAHYLDALRMPEPSNEPINPGSADAPLSPIRTGEPLTDLLGTPPPPEQKMTLILGGYSYGSLIATHLPPYEAILERFAHVSQGTAEAEIRLRASSLATQWNRDAQMHCEISRGRSLKAPSAHHHGSPSPRRSLSLVMGGEESEPGAAARRSSRESRRRSLDVVVRKSLERSRIHIGRRRISSSSGEEKVPRTSAETTTAQQRPLSPVHLKPLRICFLLVSPLLPPISSLATFFSISSGSSSRGSRSRSVFETDSQQTLLLADHPTLAVYGNRDLFTSQKKLRVWALALRRRPDSLFRFHEVPGAGHFWREQHAEEEMRRQVRTWVQGLEQ